jgi:DcmR-like sensory protein
VPTRRFAYNGVGDHVKQTKQHNGHFHAVRFYQDADGLSRIVSNFLAEGFGAHEPGVVIATPAHMAQIEGQLLDRGIDVARLAADGDLILLDADATLAEFMADGMPDGSRFRQTMTPVLEKACRGRHDSTVRAYGEMVDVLWKAGQSVAAIRLETLWNSLAHSHTFSLLCGYAIGSFYKDGAVDNICGQHSHVMTESGQAAIVH